MEKLFYLRFMSNQQVIDWLLQGDAAIRWQVMRDLLKVTDKQWKKEQRLVAREGWGKKLLSFQDPEGTWAGGVYTPKWTSTTYTLLLLRDMGLENNHPAAIRACKILEERDHSKDGGINYWHGRESETCVTGMILSIFSWFGYHSPMIHRLVDYLLEQQMPDGGWNCRRAKGATHSSFHTTIIVLEGVALYDSCFPGPLLKAAMSRALEFMLQHRLFRSHRTDRVFDPRMIMFSFPPRWHYDILRMLDYMAGQKFPWDPRMQDALDILKKKQDPTGRWPLQQPWPGHIWFELEAAHQPSRWNTLRALRILSFYGN